MRPLGVGVLVLSGMVGVALGVGWAVAVAAGSGIPPTLTLAGPLGLVALVLALGLAARYMGRVRRRTAPVDPHLAVRILALGRAGAIVGAALAGGFLGVGVQRVSAGLGDGPGGRQLVFAGLGVLAGLALTATGLVVERACRNPDDEDGPDRPGGPTGGVRAG